MMKKWLCVMSAFVLVLSSFAACGDAETEQKDEERTFEAERSDSDYRQDTVPESAKAETDETEVQIAFDGSEGLKYGIVKYGETCYVSGVGSCTDKDVIIPTVSPDGYKVVGIGSYAFKDCNTVESVTLHSGIEYVDSSAFQRCTGLEEVIFADTGLTKIGGYAFEGCTALESISIPDSVQELGICAFTECTGLTDFTLGAGISTLNGTFWGCTGLVSVEIPDTVSVIGDSAFKNCTALSSVEIPEGVTLIDNAAFNSCESLVEIDFPNTLTEIGNGAFIGCDGLTEIVIPDNVTVVGEKAFWYCTNLVSVTFGSGLKEIGKAAFSETSITEIIIPEGVETIGDAAFQVCRKVLKVSIPKSVKSIGQMAFNACQNIEEVYYGGSQDDWNSIAIGEYNTEITEADIVFGA